MSVGFQNVRKCAYGTHFPELLYSSSMHMFCALLLIRTGGQNRESAFVTAGKNSNSEQSAKSMHEIIF